MDIVEKLPVNLLLATHKFSNLLKFPISVGITPVNLFSHKHNVRKSVNFPNSDGIVLVNLLPNKYISVN